MFQRPRGTRDFGPEIMPIRRWAENAMRKEALKRGFREIQMPTFEELDLFTTKSGPGIIDELYAFKDKGGRNIALRPEMTAQAMRFYISDLSTLPKPLKLFYFGPCFRYEKPQSGRFREFFQIGAEIIGARTPETDAEIISLAVKMMESIGLKNFNVRIGHIGVMKDIMRNIGLPEERIAEGLHYLDKLNDERFSKFAKDNSIPEDAIEQMRLLRELKGGAEIIKQLSDQETGDYLRKLSEILPLLGINDFELDMGIVRGLDYYGGMVFEIDAPLLGAEKQICGGGSYDLIALLGGEEVYTSGFAIGFDRTLIALEKEGVPARDTSLDAFVIPVDGDTREKAIEIAGNLRKRDISVDFDLMQRNLSKNLKYASAVSARYAIIIGRKDLSKGIVTVRDMKTGNQKEISIDALLDFFC